MFRLALLLVAALSACSSGQLGVAGTGGNAGIGDAGGSSAGGTAGSAMNDGGRGAQGGGQSCRPSSPCPAGWYLYVDRSCSPPLPDGGAACGPLGDGLCYQPCASSADCTDPHTPNCTALYIFNSSDVGHPMTVCTSMPPIAACAADGGPPARDDAF